MSQIDDKRIRERLKIVSQIEPSCEGAERAVKKTRQTLTNSERSEEFGSPAIWRNIFNNPITKCAAAAVLMICFGYIGGRLSAGQPVDAEQLRAAIRDDLIEEMSERRRADFAADCARLKDELARQVRRDLTEFATQTLAASGTITNQRLTKLTLLIEAARIKDRERIEKAFRQIELNQTQLGKSLLAIASRTNELEETQEF
jgi:hypothetical protein